MLNEDLKDSIHDILVDVNNKVPNENQVIKVIISLPNSILLIGHEWGYYDTVFRDKVYKWMKDNI